MAAVGSSSGCLTSAANFAGCLSDAVINPILLLIFAAGLLVFIWGLIEYMWGLSTAAENKEQGRQHMLWGLIGMFVMLAAWGILQLIARTLNVSLPY